MKKYLFVVLLCLSSLASFGTARPEVKKAFKANVQTYQETVLEKAHCSATAIGPHALLTASHCELQTDELEVSSLDKPVKILERIRDGNDHTIYLIDGDALKDTIEVAQNSLELTDPVFIWGNPGEFQDMYRVGVFSGVNAELGMKYGLFQLPIYPGDSGAGIFNESGQLVEVVSMTVSQSTKDGRSISFAGAFPLDFKQEDLDKAVKFTSQKDSDVNKPNTSNTDNVGPVTQ